MKRLDLNRVKLVMLKPGFNGTGGFLKDKFVKKDHIALLNKHIKFIMLECCDPCCGSYFKRGVLLFLPDAKYSTRGFCKRNDAFRCDLQSPTLHLCRGEWQ